MTEERAAILTFLKGAAFGLLVFLCVHLIMS
jgi:hypothetical protein